MGWVCCCQKQEDRNVELNIGRKTYCLHVIAELGSVKNWVIRALFAADKTSRKIPVLQVGFHYSNTCITDVFLKESLKLQSWLW